MPFHNSLYAWTCIGLVIAHYLFLSDFILLRSLGNVIDIYKLSRMLYLSVYRYRHMHVTSPTSEFLMIVSRAGLC